MTKILHKVLKGLNVLFTNMPFTKSTWDLWMNSISEIYVKIVGSSCTKHEKHGLINKHSTRHRNQSRKLFVELWSKFVEIFWFSSLVMTSLRPYCRRIKISIHILAWAWPMFAVLKNIGKVSGLNWVHQSSILGLKVTLEGEAHCYWCVSKKYVFKRIAPLHCSCPH